MSCAKDNVAKLKAFYESKIVQVGLILYTVCSGIASMTSAITAFQSFKAATGEFNGILQNWKTPPITSITVSSTGECPSGYHDLPLPKWPGTFSDACACPSGATWDGEAKMSSSTSTCDTNETKAGCITQPEIKEVSIKEWHGGLICFRREGEPQLIDAKKGILRSVATKSASCYSKKYKACGTGTTKKDRTTCVPSSQTDCPLTGAKFGASYTAAPAGYPTNVAAVDGSGAYYFNVGASGSMPINQLRIALWDGSGKRGDCFEQKLDQREYAGQGPSYTYANNYPSECKKMDTRWEVLDAITESENLETTFLSTPACTASSVPSNKSDYMITGVQCADTEATALATPGCMVYFNGNANAWGGRSCGSSDKTCQNIMLQSNCGALGRWASQATKLEWAVLARHEMYWEPECEVNMIEIGKAEKTVNDSLPALEWNMGLNVAVNIIIGIIIPFLILYNMFYGDVPCIPGEGKVEKDLIEANKKYISLFLHVAKLVPAGLAVRIFATGTGIVQRAAEAGCGDSSDNRTDQTFEILYEELITTNEALMGQIYNDCFALLVALAMWIMERLKDHDSADDESSPTETPFDDREAKLEKVEKDEEGEKI